MRLRKVDSSNIQAIAYSRRKKVLTVLFHSGAVYHYKNVPRYKRDRLFRSRSKGEYFNEAIRSHPEKHPYEKEDNGRPPTAAGY